ncbi:MAG: FlaD/FlaE family flagellar protein [archaeon]
MLLVESSPYISIFFSFGVVAIGFASWLGGGDETETEEIQEGDDEFAMDDDFGMDDFDDDFGGMGDVEEGGTGANTTELENRIEDLESEIANVSSTANTVRSENEQISEKVDDVEENVRKLLEIYEMVTRGVNPFVDDVSTEAGLGGDGGSFGLFDDDENATEETDDDLDSDIADAEAEDFFDDDAFDDFDDEFSDEDLGEDDALAEFEMEDEGESIDDFDDVSDGEDDAETETMDDEDDSGGGGTSFEELKAEYESGDADWADEEIEDGEGEAADDTLDETDEAGSSRSVDDDPEDLFIEDDLAEEELAAEELSDAESDERVLDESAEPVSASTPESTETTPRASSTTDDAGFQFGAAAVSTDGEGPYLERPPDGYLADVVLLEWLDFLVDSYDARTAVRAVNYYERIGWIGEPMRDHCVEMIVGITDAEYVYRDEFGTTDISMADHRKSLGYVEELAGGRLERTFADSLDSRESDGI